MGSSEKRAVSISENDDELINSDVFSGGKRLNMEIINQYGQLMGDYSKLDDELWLSAPDDCAPENEEGMAFCSEGLDWKIVPSSHTGENIGNMQLSKFADNSLTGGSMASLDNNSSSLNDSSQKHSRTFSPISVLRKRSSSNETTFILKRAQSKHRRTGQVRTKKISDLLQLQSADKIANPTQQRNPNLELVKTCVDCGSSKTPQWRDGPEGRKTLCNACGLRYKKSLLTGYYVPLRIIKPQVPVVKKCLHCESADTPQWRDGPEGLKTLCNACGIQHRKGRPLRTPGSNRGPYKKKVKEIIVTEESEIDHNFAIEEKTIPDMTPETDDMKKVKEMISAENSEIDHNYAVKAKTMEELFGSDSDPDFEPIPKRKRPDCDFESIPRRKRTELDFEPIFKKKLPIVENKMCTHCETTETPQWREGPMGRKTLCNACGVQYRQGRLFPEYRPLQSPTYDPSVHSHLPKKVEKMRMQKLSEGATTSGDNDKPLVTLDG